MIPKAEFRTLLLQPAAHALSCIALVLVLISGTTKTWLSFTIYDGVTYDDQVTYTYSGFWRTRHDDRHAHPVPYYESNCGLYSCFLGESDHECLSLYVSTKPFPMVV